MTEKVKNILSMLISAVGMVALVLTTVFCLVTPESIRKSPNTITSPTSYQVSANPLIKAGGIIDPAVLTALVEKIGPVEYRDAQRQKNLMQINNGIPVTVKLFETIVNSENNANLFTQQYWQAVYLTENILTLWMVEPYTTSKYGDSGKTYEDSLVRNTLVNLLYPLLDNEFNLTSKLLITSPKDLRVPWQTDENLQLDTTPFSLRYNAVNNLLKGACINDKLWLPSGAEVVNTKTSGAFDGGIWATTPEALSYSSDIGFNGSFSWLRSECAAPSPQICMIGGAYGDTGYNFSTSTFGVRPAIHINLNRMYSLCPKITASIDKTRDERATINGVGDYSKKYTNLIFNTSYGYAVNEIILNETISLKIPAIDATAEGITYTTYYSDDKRTLNLRLTSITQNSSFFAGVGNVYSVRYNSNPPEGKPAQHPYINNCIYGISVNLEENYFSYPGYIFLGWAESTNGDKVYIDKQLVSDLISIPYGTKELYAVWGSTGYEIKACAMPSIGGTVSGGKTVNRGEAVTLTATPNKDYAFAGWYGGANGLELLSTNATYTFTPSTSASIIGFFALRGGGYAVNVSSANSAAGTAALQSISGNNVTCIALPNIGYNFTGWYSAITGGNLVSNSNPYQFEMTGNTTLYARFAVSSASTLVSLYPSVGGEARVVSGTGNLNMEITVVAVPYLGYNFIGWVNVATGATVSDELTYKFKITGPLTLRPNFVVQTFTASSLSINHAADLVKLANLVNSGQTLSGVTVTLETDVDIGALSREWESIGTASTKFAGIFQGNGHKITNSGASNLNLFASGTTAQVYNLQLGEKVVAGATVQNNGLLPVAPEPDDWATINPGGR